MLKVGVLVLSDRASQGIYEDKSGPAILDLLKSYLAMEWKEDYRVIPDDFETIKTTLKEMINNKNHIILTSGGTGPSKRDVTPEATMEICDKILPGFGELMRAVSLEKVPTAILSRSLAGIKDESLIINLPGSPKAIKECLEAVFPAIPDCVNLVSQTKMECDESVIKVHKPKH